MKKKPETPKMFYATRQIIAAADGISQTCKDDFVLFYANLVFSREKHSKETHYNGLDEWRRFVYEMIHHALHKHGFVNGNPEANAKNKDATFWNEVYGIAGSIIYSPYLVTDVANHHSSAYERNKALICELGLVIDSMKLNNVCVEPKK